MRGCTQLGAGFIGVHGSYEWGQKGVGERGCSLTEGKCTNPSNMQLPANPSFWPTWLISTAAIAVMNSMHVCWYIVVRRYEAFVVRAGILVLCNMGWRFPAAVSTFPCFHVSNDFSMRAACDGSSRSAADATLPPRAGGGAPPVSRGYRRSTNTTALSHAIASWRAGVAGLSRLAQ